ncbi:DUF535 domain-containing protein [Duganella sp. CY15W]|uniref:DUF535 family protein n=1 Tax=Duganella sp. CY15W TaxID=2692172 RepID=UPI001370D566|nr:DUF535 family protein [Duganella sp. CY15W]MYM28008.1 DUF535 domain-containing protein [Duganella sp. CY15W]
MYAPTISPSCGANDFRGLKWLRESAKLNLRAFLHPYATDKWLVFLNSDALFADLATIRPRLICKIYRPYQSNTMTCSQRVRVLIGHYTFIQAIGWGALTLKAARSPVLLASVAGKSGAVYQLQLCAVEPLEREGELALRLLRNNELVYSCAFTFLRTGAAVQMGVGCMQGPKGDHGLALVRTATSELHGLRPKNLMVKLLNVLGHDLGCQHMQLVSNRNRVLLRAQRQGKVHADYDDFWRSCGALPRPDGNFELPCSGLKEPCLLTVPSRKRAAARRRHDTVCQFAAGVLAALPRGSARQVCSVRYEDFC